MSNDNMGSKTVIAGVPFTNIRTCTWLPLNFNTLHGMLTPLYSLKLCFKQDQLLRMKEQRKMIVQSEYGDQNSKDSCQWK